MSENSLFAYLLRSSWWVSFVAAMAISLAARFLLPEEYALYALSFAFPFVVTGAIAAWRQWRVPGAGRVAATVETVGAMSWREFSALMAQAFQNDGAQVTRSQGAADFTLVKAGRTTLVSCKRWKAASHGLEPLRELEAAREAAGAHAAIYVATGNLTDNARRFAAVHRIALLQGQELTRLLRLSKSTGKRAT